VVNPILQRIGNLLYEPGIETLKTNKSYLCIFAYCTKQYANLCREACKYSTLVFLGICLAALLQTKARAHPEGKSPVVIKSDIHRELTGS
jgi:hypothetical protein